MLHIILCPKSLLSSFITADSSTHVDIKHVLIDSALVHGDNMNDNSDEI